MTTVTKNRVVDIKAFLIVGCIISECILFGYSSTLAQGNRQRPIVGAIRWDAWHGQKDGVNEVMEKTLAPKRYHNRLPFFARVINSDSVRIDGSAPEIMEKEIAYASYAGLDYWAFVLYSEHDKLSLGLETYLQSKRRKEINFCAITEQSRFTKADTSYINYLVRLMKTSGYQQVLQGRPLWYFGFIDSAVVRAQWGSFRELRSQIDSVRSAVSNTVHADPYLVIMDFNASMGSRWADSLGADAISSYVAIGKTEASTFTQLAQETEVFWESCRKTGRQVVPIWDAGWNPRPRIDHPVPWHVYPPLKHYDDATPQDLSDHFSNGVKWMKNNYTSANAQCAIIYAWNEFDEGGWLCPTLGPDTSHIQSLRGVLKAYQSK
jgi:hypothetical protein